MGPRARALLRVIGTLKSLSTRPKNIEVWFLEATKAIEKSKMTGVTLPDLPIIERTIAQQQKHYWRNALFQLREFTEDISLLPVDMIFDHMI